MQKLFVAFSLLLAGFAGAEPAADIANKELTAQSSIDEILDALDVRGKGFKTFTADVKLSETATDFGDATTRSGKVVYQDQGDGKARICVRFDTLDKGGGKTSKERLEYKLEDGKLVERNYKKRSEDTNQVLRPGEKIDLFKLGQGPFPLPIGQPKEEVHKQFDVKKVEAGKDDPPRTVHIRLTPNPDTKLARKLKTIDAWVEVNSHMPTRIGTLDRNGMTDRTTELSNVQINPTVGDKDFDLGKLPDPNWNTIEQPYQE